MQKKKNELFYYNDRSSCESIDSIVKDTFEEEYSNLSKKATDIFKIIRKLGFKGTYNNI